MAVRLPVRLQIRNAREPAIAALAQEPLDSGVRRNVRQQALSIGKRLVAEQTLERLVAGVFSFMHLHLALRPERFRTMRTLKRQIARVHRHVRLQ